MSAMMPMSGVVTSERHRGLQQLQAERRQQHINELLRQHMHKHGDKFGDPSASPKSSRRSLDTVAAGRSNTNLDSFLNNLSKTWAGGKLMESTKQLGQQLQATFSTTDTSGANANGSSQTERSATRPLDPLLDIVHPYY